MSSSLSLLRRAAAALAALALLCESGGHWVILQSIAWAGMVASYAQDRPLAEAVADTFDGQHPCDLCTAVAEGQKHERRGGDKSTPTQDFKGLKKLTVRLAEVPIGLPADPAVSYLLAPDAPAAASVRAEDPPTPPPRAA